jgi:hypothetical protein
MSTGTDGCVPIAPGTKIGALVGRARILPQQAFVCKTQSQAANQNENPGQYQAAKNDSKIHFNAQKKLSLTH